MTLTRLSETSPTTQHQLPVGSTGVLHETEWAYQWFGDPWHTRATKCEDLRDDEDFDEEEDHSSDGGFQSFTRMETVFYEAFVRTRVIDGSKGKAVEVASDFEIYKVGDTVLIDFDNGINPSVGVIVALWDTRVTSGFPVVGENYESMKIRVHWFVRPEQTAQVSVRRQHLKNEIYYSVDETAVVAPADVVSHCVVTSTHPDPEILPSVSKSSPIQGSSSKRGNFDGGLDTLSKWPASAVLFCKFALDARQGLYFDFDWEHHRAKTINEGLQESGLLWDAEVDKEKQMKMRKEIKMGGEKKSDHGLDVCSQTSDGFGQHSDSDTDITTEDGWDLSAAHFGVGESSSSKRKQPHLFTGDVAPLKRRKLTTLTPPSTDALGARSEGTSEPSRSSIGVTPESLPRATGGCAKPCNLPRDQDPWLRVMHALTLEHLPDAYTCREDEYIEIMTAITSMIDVGMGGCIYVTGDPGTGKTATMLEVVDELKDLVGRNEINPFTYVEINGSKIPEPSIAYSLLWEAFSGRNAVADKNVEISPGDALENLHDHFITELAGPGSHACVVVLEELDQLVTPTQDVIFNFFHWCSLPWSTLIVVAVSNILDMPERVWTPDPDIRLDVQRVKFLPYRVNQLQELVQARLDVAKEGLGGGVTIDVFKKDTLKFLAMKILSGNARKMLDLCRRCVELIRSTRDETVGFVHVLQVLHTMPTSPTIPLLGGYSPHQRIMLASLLRCLRRERVDSVWWENVRRQHRINMDFWLGGEDPEQKRRGDSELSAVLSSLVDDGVICSGVESGGRRALALQIEAGKIERMLLETGGEFWKRLLGD